MEAPRLVGGGGRFWLLVGSGGLSARFRGLLRLSRPFGSGGPADPVGVETAGVGTPVANTGVDGDTESSVVDGVGGIGDVPPLLLPFELIDRFMPYADVLRRSVRGGDVGT